MTLEAIAKHRQIGGASLYEYGTTLCPERFVIVRTPKCKVKSKNKIMKGLLQNPENKKGAFDH